MLRYLLTDHQGSIEAITDSAGENPIYSSFTALGVRRDPIDWSGSPSSTHDAITRQGYTFQTLLGRMGLNHMNGRVHDAVSGTFLSPDPFIPDPLNTQAFNRYAYVYNNPMTYTDPSGFSPDDECWGFCWWPPIIPQDILIPPEYRDVVRMCMMGWCPLNYERSLSPDKAAATINPGPDRRGTGKISDATDTVRRVMLPYTAALQDRGVQGTWRDYGIGLLKGGYNIAQQTAAASRRQDIHRFTQDSMPASTSSWLNAGGLNYQYHLSQVRDTHPGHEESGEIVLSEVVEMGVRLDAHWFTSRWMAVQLPPASTSLVPRRSLASTAGRAAARTCFVIC